MSVEEQQRVLGEDKIGFKKGSGASSPASKKKNPKAKVKQTTKAKDHFCIFLCFPYLMSFYSEILQANTEKPKRPISAMFIFSEEKRPKLQQERPDLSESELTRLLARMWNELPDKKKVNEVITANRSNCYVRFPLQVFF